MNVVRLMRPGGRADAVHAPSPMRTAAVFASLTLFAACGGEDQITIKGTVTGLAGSGLVLTNNGGDELAITADGDFAFAKTLPRGTAYSIAIATQPTSPWQVCSLANGDGKAGD